MPHWRGLTRATPGANLAESVKEGVPLTLSSEASGARRPAGQRWAVAAAAALAVLVLFPVLQSGFFGDDISLWHEGQKLLADPSSFFIGPSNFYRPANAWLFAANHLAFGSSPLGYHVVTLLMHLTCGVLLGRFVGRFVSSPWAVLAASTLWLCSPYAFGPVQYVNIAYNDLTVIAVWLALANLWPGDGNWARWRIASVAGLIAFSVFCKESWVIVPGLVFAFELFIAGKTVRRALPAAALTAIPVGVYLAVYAVVFAGRGGYYDFGLWAAAKVSHLWACFSLITILEPTRPGFGPAESIATLLMLGIAILGWRRRSALIGIGYSMFFLTVLPILFIPFLPTRYTAAPLLGFVLVMAGVAREIAAMTPVPRRWLATTGIAAAATVLIVTNFVWVRGEIGDMHRLSRHYTALLQEAEAFAGQIPTDKTLICVRLERQDPLRRLLAEGSLGLPKTYYQRDRSPYGLANWAHLLTFVRSDRGREIFLDVKPSGPEDLPSGPHEVIGHVEGAFRLLPARGSTALEEWVTWRNTGHHVMLVLPPEG